jgi:hypothetical protein
MDETSQGCMCREELREERKRESKMTDNVGALVTEIERVSFTQKNTSTAKGKRRSRNGKNTNPINFLLNTLSILFSSSRPPSLFYTRSLTLTNLTPSSFLPPPLPPLPPKLPIPIPPPPPPPPVSWDQANRQAFGCQARELIPPSVLSKASCFPVDTSVMSMLLLSSEPTIE